MGKVVVALLELRCRNGDVPEGIAMNSFDLILSNSRRCGASYLSLGLGGRSVY